MEVVHAMTLLSNLLIKERIKRGESKFFSLSRVRHVRTDGAAFLVCAILGQPGDEKKVYIQLVRGGKVIN